MHPHTDASSTPDPNPVILRPARWPDDLAAILAIDRSYTTDRVLRVELTPTSAHLHEELLPEPLTKQYALEVAPLKYQDVTVAELGGRVVGFAAVEAPRWNGRDELQHLYVDPPYRGRGIARRLVEAVVAKGRSRGSWSLAVETQNVNPGAVAFYRSLGFTWCGFNCALYDVREPEGGEVALFFSVRLDAGDESRGVGG